MLFVCFLFSALFPGFCWSCQTSGFVLLCCMLLPKLSGPVSCRFIEQRQCCFVCGSFVSRLSRVVRKAPTASLYWSSGIFPNCI